MIIHKIKKKVQLDPDWALVTKEGIQRKQKYAVERDETVISYSPPWDYHQLLHKCRGIMNKQLYVCNNCATAVPVDIINKLRFIYQEKFIELSLGWPKSRLLQKRYGYDQT